MLEAAVRSYSYDGEAYEMENKDCLYVGFSKEELIFTKQQLIKQQNIICSLPLHIKSILPNM